MDELDLAVSLLKTEMEKLKKENEFLKKKKLIELTQPNTQFRILAEIFERNKNVTLSKREIVRTIFIANVLSKKFFDEETQKLKIPN